MLSPLVFSKIALYCFHISKQHCPSLPWHCTVNSYSICHPPCSQNLTQHDSFLSNTPTIWICAKSYFLSGAYIILHVFILNLISLLFNPCPELPICCWVGNMSSSLSLLPASFVLFANLVNITLTFYSRSVVKRIRWKGWALAHALMEHIGPSW